MRRFSKRRESRLAEVKAFREAFRSEIILCEMCGKKRHLDIHEIARGCTRQQALDKRYAILALCRLCHDRIDSWPRSRQLALLSLRRPLDHNLDAYHALVGRKWPYIEDIQAELKLLESSG